MMFSENHHIWYHAANSDFPDEMLHQAEELINRTAVQEFSEIRFNDWNELLIASLLLMDDLLPAPARVAFANVMIDAMIECSGLNCTVESLHSYQHKPKPGRPKSPETLRIYYDVMDARREGMKLTEAFDTVANKHNKSVHTIEENYKHHRKHFNEALSRGDIEP